MGTTSQKLTYLNTTKSKIKQSINNLGGNITGSTTFRQYATELDSIYASLPKVSGTGSNISLSPTLKGRLGSVLKGNTLQDGTPTPDSPVDIQSATGLQTITISDGTNSQTKELNLGNIKLNKIGTYQDYITGTPNNWSIVRENGEIVLDGSISFDKQDTWSAVGNNTNAFYKGYSAFSNMKPNGNIISDKFVYLTNLPTNDTYGIYLTTNLMIRVPKSVTSSAELATWLSNNNVKVIYLLAEPTTTPITNTELISQLNDFYNAKSYNGQTNISVEGDLPMILTASALKGDTQ